MKFAGNFITIFKRFKFLVESMLFLVKLSYSLCHQALEADSNTRSCKFIWMCQGHYKGSPYIVPLKQFTVR